LLHTRKAIGDPGSSTEAIGVLREDVPQRPGDVLILGVATGLFFRIDETIVEHDLKPPAARRDQDEAVNDSLELIEQLIGRAHGTVSVASNGAVFDAEIHGNDRSRHHEDYGTSAPEHVRDPQLAAGVGPYARTDLREGRVDHVGVVPAAGDQGIERRLHGSARRDVLGD
jgi:hypothetical protein